MMPRNADDCEHVFVCDRRRTGRAQTIIVGFILCAGGIVLAQYGQHLPPPRAFWIVFFGFFLAVMLVFLIHGISWWIRDGFWSVRISSDSVVFGCPCEVAVEVRRSEIIKIAHEVTLFGEQSTSAWLLYAAGRDQPIQFDDMGSINPDQVVDAIKLVMPEVSCEEQTRARTLLGYRRRVVRW